MLFPTSVKESPNTNVTKEEEEEEEAEDGKVVMAMQIRIEKTIP